VQNMEVANIITETIRSGHENTTKNDRGPCQQNT
jgi:hypothetical protein